MLASIGVAFTIPPVLISLIPMETLTYVPFLCHVGDSNATESLDHISPVNDFSLSLRLIGLTFHGSALPSHSESVSTAQLMRFLPKWRCAEPKNCCFGHEAFFENGLSSLCFRRLPLSGGQPVLIRVAHPGAYDIPAPRWERTLL